MTHLIVKTLVISTAHMRPQTDSNLLKDTAALTDRLNYQLFQSPEEVGWTVFVPEETEVERELVALGYTDLATAIEFARGLGCDYVRFDPDGPTEAALPVYEWE